MNLYRFYRYLLDYTSFILLIVIYLYIFSGYGLRDPDRFAEYSDGLFNYRFSVLTHMNTVLRIVLLTASMLHGLSGFTLMSLRVRNRIFRKIALALIHDTLISITIHLLIFEFYRSL